MENTGASGRRYRVPMTRRTVVAPAAGRVREQEGRGARLKPSRYEKHSSDTRQRKQQRPARKEAKQRRPVREEIETVAVAYLFALHEPQQFGADQFHERRRMPADLAGGLREVVPILCGRIDDARAQRVRVERVPARPEPERRPAVVQRRVADVDVHPAIPLQAQAA
jgi:hypothetical protein